MISTKLQATRVSLMAAALSCSAAASAGERIDMGFFSVEPFSTWHTEAADGRLYSRKPAKDGAQFPVFVIASCAAGSAPACPATCDLPAIERAGLVADTGTAFQQRSINQGARKESGPLLAYRPGDYIEYEAQTRQRTADGTVYVSMRLLCGPRGFVYAALSDTSSAAASAFDLSLVLGSIKWKK